MERDKRDDEKWKKKKGKAAESLCPKKKKKGSTGWMSHRPQSVNEPADPCNKLLGRTAELEICRHSQNKKKQKKEKREREGEGGRERDRRRKTKKGVRMKKGDVVKEA